MKLYDYILNSKYDEITVYDEDYDVEVYFYKHDYFEDLDRWDDAMDELAKLLTITSFHSNDAVSVNLSQLIESKMDNLKKAKLFKVYDIDDIMDDIDRVISGHVPEEWLEKFVHALSEPDVTEVKDDKPTSGINITRSNRPLVEIVTEARMGQTFEFLCIDGIKVGVAGYSNPKDKETAIKFIQDIVNNSDKRGMQLAMEVGNAYRMAAMQGELGVPTNEKPESVEVNGKKMVIMYSNKTIYNENMTKEIANCKDLPNMPKEAIKAVLMERAARK